MKRFCLALILIASLLGPQSQIVFAAEQLTEVGSFPKSVDAQTKEAVFQLALPATVTLGINSSVKWEVQKVEFSDNLGYAFDYATQIATTRDQNWFPYLVKIENQGRQAKFNISASYGTTYTFLIGATVDGKTFSLQRSINFAPVVSSTILRPSVDLLPGFKFETSVPEPGNDLQVQVRIRATANPFKYVNSSYEEQALQVLRIGFSWIDKNGKVIKNADNYMLGDWQTFTVPANVYQSQGMIILANWARCPTSSNCSFAFKAEIPIKINFPEPKRQVSLNCDEVLRDSLSTCTILASSTAIDGTPAQVLESTRALVTIGSKSQEISVVYGQPTKFQLPSSDSDLIIRASIDSGKVTTSTLAKLRSYALSESVNESWKLQCANKNKTIECDINSTSTPKNGFGNFVKLNYRISTDVYNPKSELIEREIVSTGVTQLGSTFKFRIEANPLLQSISISIDEKSIGEETWENSQFTEPMSSRNSELKLSCPENIRSSSISCDLVFETDSSVKSIKNVQLQQKVGGKPWTNLKSVNLTTGKSTKVSFNNTLSATNRVLKVRAVYKIGSSVVESEEAEWEAAPPKRVFTESKLRAGLKSNCSNLPIRFNFLKFKSSGYSLNSWGDILYLYSLGATNFGVLDQNPNWTVGGSDAFSKATLDLWECSFPFKVK
jgi:hypothetical protein